MKKTLFSAAIIAVMFVAFAFASVEKNNAMNFDFVESAEITVDCDEFFRTYANASECWTKSSDDDEISKFSGEQAKVLNKY